MNIIAKTLSITLLTAATAFAPLTTGVGIAHAGEDEFFDPNQPHLYRQYQSPRWGRWHRPHHTYHHHNNSDAIALGIIGLGAAAIIGGAIANSNNPRVIYRQPSAPRAVSGGTYEPWSRSWYRYCSKRFRSFNAATGTYRGYDGRDHFCVAR
ncbi:BA14K-like protein [Hoeflea halophila]|uniref:Lectin-like protein BA14k n=1 Tax=Hoeflea halophila TaxID=714899 RepID=A0A286I1G5_9HYPH|nr:BA14K family protein [Hoeflea halophila]SOE13945.1 BA14K-like protein [Hoeflea halophila]